MAEAPKLHLSEEGRAAIRAQLEEHSRAVHDLLSRVAFEDEAKRQTKTLVANIQALRAEVQALRDEMRRPRPIA